MVDFSPKDLQATRAAMMEKGKEMLKDKNRMAKAAAAYLRNQLEDFHVAHLSDEQMKIINPQLRNAIYSYLQDYGDDYAGLASEESLAAALGYISRSVSAILSFQGLSSELIAEFRDIVDEAIYVPFQDFELGAYFMASYETMYVPDYCEDCVYNRMLKA